jgi:putative tricarboxylic transport membrane protein
MENILLGLDVAFTATNLLYCLLGVFIGTAVGVIPGLGPMAAISILLPMAFGLSDPITAIIFISGIYYGTQYGGSTTSILLNLPGETSSVVTTIDGYQMTKNGRGGAALTIAAVGSFVAGTVGVLIIGILGEPISKLVFLFGPAEYSALMILGFLAAVSLTQGSFIKGLGMVLIGILLGSIGIDVNSGTERFSFSSIYLYNGISFVIIAMGIFGLSEIILESINKNKSKIIVPKFRDLYPSKREVKDSLPAIARGTGIGSILGMLPGTGAIISSFASYAVEKKISKNPELFGKGAIQGVAGPESANNAAAQTSFIPALSIGIPTTPVMSLILATLIIQGIQPGPQVISSNPNLFWGLIVSMWIGNIFLLILNIPLISIWIQLLKFPKKLFLFLIIAVCIFGTYSINNSWFDVALLIPFTILGIMFKKLCCEPAPLALGFVIGPMLEEYFRRALIISEGNLNIFFDRPLSLFLLSISFIIVAGSIIFKKQK